MTYFASRAWHAGWDDFVIPQPLARIVIAIGEPVYIAKGTDSAAIERWQVDMEQRLKGLFATAKSMAE
jgi:lysophospholipid acyltransferase (LPLAT)-like uncharacterized protein